MSLRVLHVLEAVEGGTSRHLVDVVRAARGVEHEVVIPEQRVGGLTDEAARGQMEAAGAVVHLLPMYRTPWRPGNAVAVVRLRRLVRARRPDVVHGHSSIGGLLARVATVGVDVPVVYTPNGVTDVRAGRAIERALRRRTTRFVAVSASEAALAEGLGLAAPEAVVTIPNGIDATPPAVTGTPLHDELGLDPDVPLVGTIARLVPQKDPVTFVVAARALVERHDDLHAVLIGSGALEPEVLAAAAAIPPGRFHLVRSFPGASSALPELAVFALASVFEGGPYAPMEAMRAGVPVVVSDVVGNRDAVVDGVSGLVVPPGDPDALVGAVERLLTPGPFRDALVAAARERVATEFDLETMGERTTALYRSLLPASYG